MSDPQPPDRMQASVEEAHLTLEQLCSTCAVSREWVLHRVEEQLLVAPAGEPAAWRFGAATVHRVRRMHALERDFEAGPELAALVADLLDELETLRARLRRAGTA